MSKLITNTIRHTGGSADNITLDNSQNVTIEGTAKINGDATNVDGSADDLVVGNASSGKNDGITLVSNSSQNGTLAFADQDSSFQGAVGYVHNGDYLRLLTSGTQRVRVDSDGLKFGSDTAAANALDDYEEGTWTPTSAGGGWTFTNNTSRYTKVGHLVTLQMYVELTGSGNSAQIIVGGLPYNIATGGYTTSIFDMGKGSKKGAFGRSEPSAQIWFWYPSENTSNYRNTLIGTDIGGAPGYIVGSISYHTS